MPKVLFAQMLKANVRIHSCELNAKTRISVLGFIFAFAFAFEFAFEFAFAVTFTFEFGFAFRNVTIWIFVSLQFYCAH